MSQATEPPLILAWDVNRKTDGLPIQAVFWLERGSSTA